MDLVFTLILVENTFTMGMLEFLEGIKRIKNLTVDTYVCKVKICKSNKIDCSACFLNQILFFYFDSRVEYFHYENVVEGLKRIKI